MRHMGTHHSLPAAILIAAIALGMSVAADAADAAPAAAAEAAPAAAEKPDPSQPKFISSQWHSLYLSGRKIGYTAQSLYALDVGGRRLQTYVFLRRTPVDTGFGYYKMITADVDAKFRPRALDCRVVSGDRQWQVTGRVEGGEFALTRTSGDATATAKVPLDEDLTLASWALPATVLSGARPGETRRWLVIDESIGALLPDQCLVHVAGERNLPVGAEGRSLAGTAFVSVCGPEQVGHLVDAGGRVLRSVWQSTPMVAEGTSLSEARRLTDATDGPRGTEIDGLTGDRYRNPRLGIKMWIPPYPYVTHVAEVTGAVKVVDLTDEAYVYVRPAYGPGPAAPSRAPDAPPDSPPEDSSDTRADLIQHEWAARFDEVKAEARPAAGRDVKAVGGTARLGCTTFHFRNLLLGGEGLTWFVSIVTADRPVTAKPILLDSVGRSITTSMPEGRLPIQASGLALRSPYYGFEIRRPNERWKVPGHAGGPLSILEIVREDQAAVAMVRVLTPRPNEPLKVFVAEQAERAADNLGVTRPEPQATTLAGREALQISYEGSKILSGRPARCTTVYTPMGDRVLALVLVAASGADETAARELEEIRRSVKLAREAAPP